MKLVHICFFLITVYISTAQQFFGGAGDGFGYSEIINQTSINTVGGIGDGFAAGDFINYNVSFYRGGIGDGFSYFQLSKNTSYFGGGPGDGFSYYEFIGNSASYFVGGIGDGFGFITLDPIILPTICSHVDNSWIGVNGDWSNPVNWSSGTVPDICHNVTIDGPFVVSINPGADALARTLNLDGELRIKNGGSLSLDGRDTLGHIVEILGGELYNQGLLSMKNYGSGSVSRSGIRITANGILENQNTIIIDSIGTNTSHGIQIVTGIFKNKANSSITINNGVLATGYGIRNTDSLSNDGDINIYNFHGFGAIFNQSHTRNNGSFTFSDVRGGILNQDSVFNYGTISIENVTEFPGFKNSRVDSYFGNVLGADLELINVSNIHAVDNIGEIMNSGNIYLYDAQLGGITSSGGNITNSGLLYCEFFSGIGINSANDVINNSGTIELMDFSNGAFDGIKATSMTTITNSGIIEIKKGL